MDTQRRDLLKYTLATAAGSALPQAEAQTQTQAQPAAGGIDPRDRVFITNEDSNTIVVIDPRSNTVESTINLTSFDEDPRPPLRYVTMGSRRPIHKPRYHGCIDAHARCPRPTAGCSRPAGATTRPSEVRAGLEPVRVAARYRAPVGIVGCAEFVQTDGASPDARACG